MFKGPVAGLMEAIVYGFKKEGTTNICRSPETWHMR